MKKHILLILLPLLVAAILAARTVSATPVSSRSQALEPLTACHSIDLIFLVDQSASMSGSRGAEANDPTEQRREAILSAIDRITDNALGTCEGAIHRVAIVSFGNAAETDLTFEEGIIGPYLTTEPGDTTEALEVRDGIKLAVRATDLGGTNPFEAFRLARELFSEADELAAEGEIRKQAIVFITDGIPCLAVNTETGTCTTDYVGYAVDMRDQLAELFPFNGALLELEQCLSELRADRENVNNPLDGEAVSACYEANSVAPSAYENSTYIWMILMNDGGRQQPDGLQNVYAEIAQSHAGDIVNVSNNRSAVPITIELILEQLTGVRPPVIDCGPFAVNPYQESLSLTGYKFEADVSLTYSYTDVSGQEFAVSGLELIQSDVNPQGGNIPGFTVIEHIPGVNERYVFHQPYPGIWNLRSDRCDDLSVPYHPIELSGSVVNFPETMPQFDNPPFYNVERPYYLEFQLQDQRGEPIAQAEHPRFAINVTAEVESSTGSIEAYKFEYVPAEQLFRSTEPIKAPDSGLYTALLEARTYRHDGNPSAVLPNSVAPTYEATFNTEYVLSSTTFEFEVTEVLPFAISIVSPLEGDILTPIHTSPNPDAASQIYPLPVRVQVTDRSSKLLAEASSGLFTDPERTMEATIVVGDESAGVVLTPDPAMPGEFVGSIPDFGYGGEQTLSVELVGEFNAAYYPDNFQDSVTFTRADETWRFALIEPTDGAMLNPIHDRPYENGLHWPQRVLPIPVRVQLVDESGQPYANPDDVMAYAPTVISATVRTVEGHQVRSTLLVPNADYPGQYIGEVEAVSTQGEYELTVDLNVAHPQFSPLSEPATVTFTREDVLTTQPLFWQAIAGIVLVVALALTSYVIYLLTGGPKGSLEVVGLGTYGRPQTLGGPWRLRFIPRHNRIKNNRIKELGYRYVGVKRVRSYDSAIPHAVQIEAKNEHGIVDYQTILLDGIPEPFIQGVDLVYRNKNQNGDSY